MTTPDATVSLQSPLPYIKGAGLAIGQIKPSQSLCPTTGFQSQQERHRRHRQRRSIPTVTDPRAAAMAALCIPPTQEEPYRPTESTRELGTSIAAADAIQAQLLLERCHDLIAPP